MKKILFLFLFAFTIIKSSAQLALIRNFNNSSANTFTYSSNDGIIASFGNKVFVRHDSTILSSMVTLLKLIDINGIDYLQITVPYRNEDFTPTFYDFRQLSNGKVAFVANENDTDYNIYITDGTTLGTQLVVSSSTYISGIETINSGLYFTREKEAALGSELMKIDLTTSAVTNVKDFGYFYYISDISKVDNTKLVFMATDDTDLNKYKLYSSDGTNAGTAPISFIYDGSGVSQQTVMTQVGNKVYFFYKESGSDCCNHLYVTDGTTSGTTKLKEFNTVFLYDYEKSRSALHYSTKFYFMAVDNGANVNNDKVLWVSDGTTIGTIPLHLPADYTNPKFLTPFNSKVYFVAYDINSYNYKLYSTDGTATGTTFVSTTNNATTLYPYEIVSGGTYLYLAADNNTQGAELFRYDGINEECGLAEGVTGSNSADPKSLYVNGTDLYLTAYTDATGRELFTATNFVETINGVKIKKAFQPSLFPNPTNNNVTVNSEFPIEKITLLSELGKELLTVQTETISVAEYSAGVYYLKIKTVNQEPSFQKLIITK
jgi:hypothetical protein